MSTPVSPILPLGTTPDDSTFVVASSPPQIGFLKRGVQPPSGVYVEASDVLVFACATSATGELVTVSYRLLRFDGALIHGQFTIQPPNTRVVTAHQEPLAEGFLLSMSCKATIATTRGVTFARAFLTKPGLGAGQPSYMLMTNYVTTAMASGFPNGRLLEPVEGPGNTRYVSVVPPVAGADWSTVVPTNARWALNSIIFALQTSAVAGNRFVDILTQGGPGTSFRGFAEAAAVANAFNVFCCSPTPNKPFAGSNNFWLPLSQRAVRSAGTGIGTQTSGILAADQYSNIVLDVEEWLDNV